MTGDVYKNRILRIPISMEMIFMETVTMNSFQNAIGYGSNTFRWIAMKDIYGNRVPRDHAKNGKNDGLY